MLPLRLAILECDTPMDTVKARYGSYGDIFENHLQSAVRRLNCTADSLIVSKWDVVNDQAYPDSDDIDAVLMTGSRHTSFDNDPWILKLVEYVSYLLNKVQRIRVVGICFGHQIVARALKAELGRNESGWEVSVVPFEMTEVAVSLFGGMIKNLSLQQMHRDIVHTLPPGTLNLGRSSVCDIQGLYIPEQLFTLQGHPEFNEDIEREILTARRSQGIIDEDTFQDAIARVGHEHDGKLVQEVILKFVGISACT